MREWRSTRGEARVDFAARRAVARESARWLGRRSTRARLQAKSDDRQEAVGRRPRQARQTSSLLSSRRLGPTLAVVGSIRVL